MHKAIDNKLQGIEAVQAEYQWGGDWETVKVELRRLRIRLRLAVRARNEFATHVACLVNYLKQCQARLALDRNQ